MPWYVYLMMVLAALAVTAGVGGLAWRTRGGRKVRAAAGVVLFCLAAVGMVGVLGWPSGLPAQETERLSDQQTEGSGSPTVTEPAAGQTGSSEVDLRDVWWVKLLVTAGVIIVPFLLGGFFSSRWRMQDYRGKITLVCLCLLAGVAVTVMGWPPKFGIDLRGGVILVYELEEPSHRVDGDRDEQVDEDLPQADQTKVDMDKLIAALARRLNPGGQKELTIRQFGARQIEIIVPEADPAEVERIKGKVSRAGTLEFRILANDRRHKSLIERAGQQDARELRADEGNLLAWWVPVTLGEEDSFLYTEIAKRTRTRRGEEFEEILVVNDNFNVNGGYLVRATTDVDQQGRPCVNFIFNRRGGRLFGGLTSKHLPDEATDFSCKLGIILDGYLYSAPRINSTIRERGVIEGEFTQQAVQDLVDVLNAGSLPTALKEQPISELNTGPTLGADTIAKGKNAIILSMVLVLLFMLAYYRFAGVVACMALLTNLVLILAIMITIKAAFTLPGLAGLVLTVGIAVDANVLIFERIREELARNAAMRMAIRNGFSRATSAIVDANLTTLITATILYVVGEDQIRGFAVTLWLGVVLSMFTAIFCSRVVFDVAEKQKWISRLTMLRLLGGTDIDFLGRRRVAAAFSIVVISIGLVGVVLRGKGILDIDFTGGVRVQIVFTEPQDIAQIRRALSDLPDLAVSNVRLSDEKPDLRFIINTSSPPDKEPDQYLDEIRQRIQDTFGKGLAHYSMTVSPLPSDRRPPAGKGTGEGPATPGGSEQTRDDLPAHTLLASVDPSPILLAQADDSAEPPAEQPTGPPTDEPAQTSAEKPAEAPPEKTAAPPEAEPAKTAADQAAEAPAERPAEAPADQAAGETHAKLQFEHAVNYETLEDMFKKEFESGGFEEAEFELFNPRYEPGDEIPYGSWGVTVKLPPEKGDALLEAIKTRLESTPVFPLSSTIGGKVAGSMRTKGVVALLASLLCIVGYIWIRFQRVMFGLAAVVALVHDVLITLGVIALSAYVANFLGFLLIEEFKIGLPVLAAFLTIIGYSLNDTIVVFDRIREVRGKAPRLTEQMINFSINQTLGRTLLTSLTTLLVVVILYIGGGQGIHTFAFSLVVGVIVGTYSSIFVASPVLLWMSHPPKQEAR